MESLNEYITEQKVDMTQSTDDIANRIIAYLMNNYKIHWGTKSVDGSIKNVTKASYLDRTCNLLPDKVRKGELLYQMSCWNGGTSLSKSYPYNNADIESPSNNTDVKWFLNAIKMPRNKYKVEVYMYEFKYYGLPCVCKLIETFTI